MAPLASVVVTNHNHAPYLGQALDSALAQSYADVEVVAVDDGSTDWSADVLAGYRGDVVAVQQANAGTDAALSAGFAASRGEVVLFLDSDDVLEAAALERAVDALSDPAVVKVHWPLREIDAGGGATGRLWPGARLSQGDLREALLAGGPLNFPWSPTSGNAFRREFLSRILPIPKTGGTLADVYLCGLAPVYGRTARLDEPLGRYRVHAANLSRRGTFEARLARGLWRSEVTFESVRAHFRAQGFEVDPEGWKAGSWWHRIAAAVQDIASTIPEGATFILANDDQWGNGDEIAGRRRLHWGPPADDASAVDELERLRALGAGHAAFVWPALWWLEHYRGLNEHLRSRHRCLLANDRAALFELRS